LKKKPDRKFVIAVLVLVAGAAAAKGLEVQRVTDKPAWGASTKWLQSQLR
jgi:hypothetical protein